MYHDLGGDSFFSRFTISHGAAYSTRHEDPDPAGDGRAMRPEDARQTVRFFLKGDPLEGKKAALRAAGVNVDLWKDPLDD